MKDDYLWDKSGEPDPEIEQLEKVLGTLRYQPRRLELPAQLKIRRPRALVSRMAIAAAVATILVGGSWWILREQGAPTPVETVSSPSPVQNEKARSEIAAAPASDEVVKSKPVNGSVEKSRPGTFVRKNLLAGKKKARPLKARDSELSASDRAEAKAAKEQLLLALRVASSKLSLVQKKTQVGYPGSQIRNQHKVG